MYICSWGYIWNWGWRGGGGGGGHTVHSNDSVMEWLSLHVHILYIEVFDKMAAQVIDILFDFYSDRTVNENARRFTSEDKLPKSSAKHRWSRFKSKHFSSVSPFTERVLIQLRERYLSKSQITDRKSRPILDQESSLAAYFQSFLKWQKQNFNSMLHRARNYSPQI